jgi:HK97 family phage prohead protease
MDKKDFIGKRGELVVKDLQTIPESSTETVVHIAGYANRFLDDSGELVVDRSNESVLPQAYDLKSFMKNPVLLYQHDQRDPVGKVISVDLRQDGLYIEAEVHKMMNEKVFYAVKEGIVRTFSIGFLIKDATEKDGVYFWTDVELLEVSIVAVPDNQESTFSVLTESPCGSGVCLLANRAVPKEKIYTSKRISNDKVSEKPWSEVNKTELKQKLDEKGDASYIREAFLVVRDVEKRSTWKFPHHQLEGEDLVLNKGGVVSAYAALKGARNEPAISTEEKKNAAAHLLKHYRTLKSKGLIEEIPEDLVNMAKEFDELYKKEISDINDEVKDDEDVVVKSAEDSKSQENDEDTIKSEDTKDEESDDSKDAPSDDKKEEGAEEKDSDTSSDSKTETGDEPVELTADLIKQYVDSSKETTEGLNELLELYLTIESVLNEAIQQQLED